jgi:hypothetical protein
MPCGWVCLNTFDTAKPPARVLGTWSTTSTVAATSRRPAPLARGIREDDPVQRAYSQRIALIRARQGAAVRASGSVSCGRGRDGLPQTA